MQRSNTWTFKRHLGQFIVADRKLHCVHISNHPCRQLNKGRTLELWSVIWVNLFSPTENFIAFIFLAIHVDNWTCFFDDCSAVQGNISQAFVRANSRIFIIRHAHFFTWNKTSKFIILLSCFTGLFFFVSFTLCSLANFLVFLCS